MADITRSTLAAGPTYGGTIMVCPVCGRADRLTMYDDRAFCHRCDHTIQLSPIALGKCRHGIDIWGGQDCIACAYDDEAQARHDYLRREAAREERANVRG